MADDPESPDWDAAGYGRNARFVADLGVPVLDLLAPQPGERVLDLGCGDGALTAEIVARGAEVVGVDASPAMVAAARSRGLDARLVDGHGLAFETFEGRPFDAVFSNAALHWMQRPEAVIAGVHRALRPGGRFVGEFGGAGNVARIGRALVAGLERRGVDAAAIWPWYFPEADAYRTLLEAGGFSTVSARLFERPTPLPAGITGWLATFPGPFLRALPAGEREPYLAEVVAEVAPALRDDTGQWWADYVRLRFSAIKTAGQAPQPDGPPGRR